jgi:hypothetical protein
MTGRWDSVELWFRRADLISRAYVRCNETWNNCAARQRVTRVSNALKRLSSRIDTLLADARIPASIPGLQTMVRDLANDPSSIPTPWHLFSVRAEGPCVTISVSGHELEAEVNDRLQLAVADINRMHCDYC